MKKSTRLLVVHLSIMSLLHSLGACQVPKMDIFSFHLMCLPSIHHIMLSCFYRIFRISTVESERVNQFFFSKKKKKNSLCICVHTHAHSCAFFKLNVNLRSFGSSIICEQIWDMLYLSLLAFSPFLNIHFLVYTQFILFVILTTYIYPYCNMQTSYLFS